MCPCTHRASVSKAGERTSFSVCPRLFSCCHHKLDTHKAPESQAAGEGDARGFILRTISLACLFPMSPADQAADGICVSEGSLPLLPSPGEEEGRMRAAATTGLS